MTHHAFGDVPTTAELHDHMEIPLITDHHTALCPLARRVKDQISVSNIGKAVLTVSKS